MGEMRGSEVSGSSEVSSSETSAETGGETSVETQESVETEGDAEGFEETENADMEEQDSEDEDGEDEVGFDEGEDSGAESVESNGDFDEKGDSEEESVGFDDNNQDDTDNNDEDPAETEGEEEESEEDSTKEDTENDADNATEAEGEEEDLEEDSTEEDTENDAEDEDEPEVEEEESEEDSTEDNAENDVDNTAEAEGEEEDLEEDSSEEDTENDIEDADEPEAEEEESEEDSTEENAENDVDDTAEAEGEEEGLEGDSTEEDAENGMDNTAETEGEEENLEEDSTEEDTENDAEDADEPEAEEEESEEDSTEEDTENDVEDEDEPEAEEEESEEDSTGEDTENDEEDADEPEADEEESDEDSTEENAENDVDNTAEAEGEEEDLEEDSSEEDTENDIDNTAEAEGDEEDLEADSTEEDTENDIDNKAETEGEKKESEGDSIEEDTENDVDNKAETEGEKKESEGDSTEKDTENDVDNKAETEGEKKESEGDSTEEDTENDVDNKAETEGEKKESEGDSTKEDTENNVDNKAETEGEKKESEGDSTEEDTENNVDSKAETEGEKKESEGDSTEKDTENDINKMAGTEVLDSNIKQEQNDEIVDADKNADQNREEAVEKTAANEEEALKGKKFDNASYEQGNNIYGFEGTCGLASSANALNRVTGTSRFSENGMVQEAVDNKLCQTKGHPSECGGITTKGVVELIDKSTTPEDKITTEVYEYDKALNVDELADKLKDDNTVAIVGVDSATLWDQRGDVSSSGLFQTEGPSDHWITVDSPVYDEKGELQGFNIIDSGGGEEYASKEKFEKMYLGSESHKISDPTSIMVSQNAAGASSSGSPVNQTLSTPDVKQESFKRTKQDAKTDDTNISDEKENSSENFDIISDKTRELTKEYYNDAGDVANKTKDLRTYSDHREQHVEQVAVKSQKAADSIEKAFTSNEHYASKIDRNELQAAALWHDTGMDGGIRKQHSLNSAIHVLENSDKIKEMGLDPNRIAVDCMAHSKSCSGVNDLTSGAEWTKCFDRIDEAVKNYNDDHPDSKIDFDKSSWTDGERIDVGYDKEGKTIESYVFKEGEIEKTASSVAALRLGDANRDAPEKPYTQAGDMIYVDINSYNKDATNWKSEIENANVTLTDTKGDVVNLKEKDIDPDGYGRMYAAGEGNLSSINCDYNADTGNISEKFVVKNGESFPHCTQKCITERMDELDTMDKSPREAVIEIDGHYSSEQRKAIEESYSKYCNVVKNDYDFEITYRFKEDY